MPADRQLQGDPTYSIGHDGFLDVKAVFRLVPHDTLRTVDHRRTHFLTAVGRQAVQENRVLLGTRHQRFVYDVCLERFLPNRLLLLLAHRRPDVSVHHIGAFDGSVNFSHNYEDVREAGSIANAGKTDWVGFTDGPYASMLDLHGPPGSVSEQESLKIANAYYERVVGN